MGLSFRRFLLGRDDVVYQLASTKFEQMFRNPGSHCLAQFAGHRVRMASVVVELLARQPTRVVHRTFHILSFDEEGHLDTRAFERHQRASAELALAPAIRAAAPSAPLVDAADRFVAQGGRWSPSRTLARMIDAAALGRVSCPRL